MCVHVYMLVCVCRRAFVWSRASRVWILSKRSRSCEAQRPAASDGAMPHFCSIFMLKDGLNRRVTRKPLASPCNSSWCHCIDRGIPAGRICFETIHASWNPYTLESKAKFTESGLSDPITTSSPRSSVSWCSNFICKLLLFNSILPFHELWTFSSYCCRDIYIFLLLRNIILLMLHLVSCT